MPLFPWQARELAEHGTDPKRAIFASPRLGKTRAAIETMGLWGVPKTVVVAPLVVCPQWSEQLRAHGYDVVDMYAGSRRTRLTRLGGPGVAVVNYDVLAALVDDFIAWKPHAIIGDESHLIKGVTTKRAKAFRRIAWRTDYTRLLTGTPSPNHYGDLWGQLVALDRDEWQSYAKFAARYLIRHAVFPSKVIGHRNVEELQARLLRYATIVRREDEFGPDTWQYVTRTVALPPEARKLYDRLAKEWFLEEEGVDATHILKRLIRLQQLSAGFLPNEEGRLSYVHEAKVAMVASDLEEIVMSGEKAVLFHRFRWESDAYARMAAEQCQTFVIHGDVPVEKRFEIVEAFRTHDGPCVAVVQAQAGGVGISFAEATHALFTSRDFSYTTDQQARDRVYKPGARRVVTLYETTRTVDQYIAKVLAEKRSVHDSVTNADRTSMAYGYISSKEE